jgi:hypothetical protein
MEAALSTAEAKLAELNSRIDALAAGQGQPPRAKILADLKALRVTLAKDTDAALKAAAERDALKAQVSAAQAENDKLNFQIGHLERACAGGGVALAEETPTKAKREKVLAALAQADVTPKTRERLDKSIAAAGDAREARLAKLGAPAAGERAEESNGPLLFAGVDGHRSVLMMDLLVPTVAGAAVLVEGPDGAQYPSTRRLYFDNMQQCSNRGVVRRRPRAAARRYGGSSNRQLRLWAISHWGGRAGVGCLHRGGERRFEDGSDPGPGERDLSPAPHSLLPARPVSALLALLGLPDLVGGMAAAKPPAHADIYSECGVRAPDRDACPRRGAANRRG